MLDKRRQDPAIQQNQDGKDERNPRQHGRDKIGHELRLKLALPERHPLYTLRQLPDCWQGINNPGRADDPWSEVGSDRDTTVLIVAA